MSFPTDSDGFLSQECPSCEQRFKVLFGEGSSEPISHCPYCGHRGEECWHTSEQVEHIQAVVAKVALEPELRKLERELKRASTELLTVEMKSDLPAAAPPPIDVDDAFEILHLPCCDETLKLTRQKRHLCIICGMEYDTTMGDQKKVFLSHKGIDKQRVLDFRETLALLGYDPWIDTDAMPAGTALERGLLQGMQESCGVVFFITPSFKDEGYLEAEIDYAIQEKRKKGDKFAIIALQFLDDADDVGLIPELLKTYVWKTPRTSLEAMREIVRALPVMPREIDWRDGIDGVVRMPRVKSTSAPLSSEAEAILKAAVNGDGYVMNPGTMGGEEISAGGESMIPNQEARTVALWLGGLEDLQRRRYIKDVGHKGEYFQVTREGYEAADEISEE